jgi:hypothetical protein
LRKSVPAGHVRRVLHAGAHALALPTRQVGAVVAQNLVVAAPVAHQLQHVAHGNARSRHAGLVEVHVRVYGDAFFRGVSVFFRKAGSHALLVYANAFSPVTSCPMTSVCTSCVPS